MFQSQTRAKARRSAVRLAAASAAALVTANAFAAQVGDVFYIAMENHNFQQPTSITSPQQIFQNSAAPYINGLITPGGVPASAQTSWANAYYNAGTGVHPSEPNYVWAEAGTDFGVHTDADPSSASNNIFNAPHLTGLLNGANVSWKNYQEDVQFSSSAIKSASGNTATTTDPNYNTSYTNPYFGTGQYNYAVKHNPMAFFPDTATQNVAPLSQLTTDLNNNTVGRYNWITPDQYNDMHSSLNTNFTYAGQTWTHNTDQEAIAIGDHFLSQVVPQIMASDAYKNNGAIVIWFDETEGGDTTGNTIPEIVISPLAKGNAYKSSVILNHSSDLATMQEIFGVNSNGGFLNNPIPATETNPAAGQPGQPAYNYPSQVNDLSDLFQSGVIPSPTSVPEPASLSVLALGAMGLLARRRA